MTPELRELIAEYLLLCMLGDISSIDTLTPKDRARLLELYRIIKEPEHKAHNECH